MLNPDVIGTIGVGLGTFTFSVIGLNAILGRLDAIERINRILEFEELVPRGAKPAQSSYGSSSSLDREEYLNGSWDRRK